MPATAGGVQLQDVTSQTEPEARGWTRGTVRTVQGVEGVVPLGRRDRSLTFQDVDLPGVGVRRAGGAVRHGRRLLGQRGGQECGSAGGGGSAGSCADSDGGDDVPHATDSVSRP